MTHSPPRDANGRRKIIAAINTPLGFFALMALIMEAVSMGWTLITPCTDRATIAILSICVLLTLALIVGILTYTNPRGLAGKVRTKHRKKRRSRHLPSNQPPP